MTQADVRGDECLRNGRPLLRCKDLVMVYPGGTRAVDGIDFAVHEGEFFGFLGPNGAGKSTALKDPFDTP